MRIALDNENGMVDPIPVGTNTGIDVPELDTLTNILQEFHDHFGDIEWTDEDKVRKQIADLPDIVRQDQAYQNAMQFSDRQNARAESDRATTSAILSTMSTGIELYKAVNGNESFRKWILDMVFNATYVSPAEAHARKKNAELIEDMISPASPAEVLRVAEPHTTYNPE